MKLQRYVVIRLDTKTSGTKIEVTATDISDRCEVYEYEEADTPQPEQGADCTQVEQTADPIRCSRGWSASCTSCERYFNCDYLSGRQTEQTDCPWK